MIRGKSKGCPFGLPVAFGCKTAGGCVSMMSSVEDIEDAEDKSMSVIQNWEILFACDNVKRCPYADVFVKSEEGGFAVDCKFDPNTNSLPAGNVGLNGSPLYPNYYVGDINVPLKGGPAGYMSDDNNSGLYFGELFSDLIKGLV